MKGFEYVFKPFFLAQLSDIFATLGKQLNVTGNLKHMMADEDNSHSIPAEHRRWLQLVFDRFAETSQWPKSREVQIAFLPGDFWSVAEEVDFHLISSRGDKSNATSQSILSIEGIAVCTGSRRFLDLFVRSLEVCVDTFKRNPTEPIITASCLREFLGLDEKGAQIAFGLLYVAKRVWQSASFPTDNQSGQMQLYPDVLRYAGVAAIEQYLEIVREYRPVAVERPTTHSLTRKERSTVLSALSTLHPTIVERCERLFRDEHYSQSVEAGFKVVRDRLRDLTGYERGQDAFGKGQLHIAGAAAKNVDGDFNEGVKFLTMAICMFRNEKSHTSNDQIDDPVHAYEYLSLSSLAMRLLDRADSADGLHL